MAIGSNLTSCSSSMFSFSIPDNALDEEIETCIFFSDQCMKVFESIREVAQSDHQKFCTSCGADLVMSGAKFCSMCGTPVSGLQVYPGLAAPSAPTMRSQKRLRHQKYRIVGIDEFSHQLGRTLEDPFELFLTKMLTRSFPCFVWGVHVFSQCKHSAFL